MREIKFRAWIKKHMNYDYWEDAVYMSGEGICLNDIFKQENVPFMQYTGLKDKNGKEIYEDDILICPSIKDYPYCIVKFGVHGKCEELYGWYVTSKGDIQAELNDSWNKYGEVIGNIYENPELLEEIKCMSK